MLMPWVLLILTITSNGDIHAKPMVVTNGSECARVLEAFQAHNKDPNISAACVPPQRSVLFQLKDDNAPGS